MVEDLDLSNAVHVGHSTGGGEATRHVARHGPGRVAKWIRAEIDKAEQFFTNPERRSRPGAILTVCPSHAAPPIARTHF